MNILKFEDFNLSKELLQAIKDMGFEEPTPIQALAIPKLELGMDVSGQAQTGTGKTAAFALPAIEKIDTENLSVQTIILAPTRELAIQIAEEFTKLLKYKQNIKVLPVYGGQPIERQLRALRSGVQVIIGTPGRVMDHLDRKTLSLNSVHTIILDEADQMLDMGFRDDIEYIIKKTPQGRQTILFSATMPKPIIQISKKYQKNPEFIKITHKELTVPQIEQTYFEVKERDKLEITCRLIDIYDPELALIFCNTKKRVDELSSSLRARGYLAEALHGDMKQMHRDRVMSKFRSGAIDILIATDVAARGIDVDEIDTVFNYDVPQDVEYYVHRIGRTARAGRPGRAISFVAPKEIYKLRTIQKFAKIRITKTPIPSITDVEEIKIKKFMEKIKHTIDEGNIEKYATLVEQMMEKDEYNSVEIAAALLKNQLDLQQKEEIKSLDVEFGDTGAEPGMVRFYISVGRDDQIRPGDIVGAFAGETSMPGKLIGAIDIYPHNSFVEVPMEYAKDVFNTMQDRTIRGKEISISPAKRGNFR